ncbi:heparan-alpha-glucosaminide N-acetyltransferase domain-containing protein [Modestobacter sp. Leaf380]|uniref:heparan-alpha-glucosaminide N-acetyltransferase domain-containing protein n=1 Tax=Modestobacter sp. Leaf380 TaxID=1736356 RepID=UPI0006FFF43D|nr:heparan-alpha-glucosaminide N-acetyltransferase domain-containing protein [Modestobacter sp. Leaf380]KQS64934.1 hypothetical protein ASG41_15990 [Modestobacter sp. Leaf380]
MTATVDRADAPPAPRRFRPAWRTPDPRRLRGVDVARGLAVLGMFGAHLLTTDELVWTDPSTWSGLVDGRSSILFATLAGVSVGLLTGRTTPPEGEALVRARLVLLTRAALLLALGGLVQLLVVPVAVILEFYAVLVVLCIPLLRWRVRSLLALAAGLVLVVNPLYHQVLLPWVYADTGGGGVLGQLGFTGVYPVATWAAFVVTGLAVGRSDLTAVRVRATLVLVGSALAVLGYGAAGVAQVTPGDADEQAAFAEDPSWRDLVPPADQLLLALPHSNTPAETIGSGGFALLVLGVCLLVADRLRWVLLPLACVGSMPLSAYCAHLVGIAWLGETLFDSTDDGVGLWLRFVVTTLVVCTLWALVLGRGPLERLVAAVTRRAVRA